MTIRDDDPEFALERIEIKPEKKTETTGDISVDQKRKQRLERIRREVLLKQNPSLSVSTESQRAQAAISEIEDYAGPLSPESVSKIEQSTVVATEAHLEKKQARLEQLIQQERLLEGLIEAGDAKERTPLLSIEGMVFEDRGFLSPDNQFQVVSAEASEVPDVLLRPMFVGEQGKQVTGDEEEAALDVKSTIAMGKAACIERPTTIDGVDYQFLQWKGVGMNQTSDLIENRATQYGGSVDFPLGKTGPSPLFVMQAGDHVLVRFMGAAYLEDLQLEAEKSKVMESYGLRMPKILGTFKFSKEFAEANNLPVPANDDPEDPNGQSLRQYILDHEQEIDPDLFQRMIGSFEAGDYQSAVLGQNVRAFRNVWRVSEMEEALSEPDETKRKESIAAMMETSKLVFAKEFHREFTDQEFVETFTRLLGAQAGTLLENRLVQGAMFDHKQDITLAAEMCDFDGSFQINETYLQDKNNQPSWVTDESTRKEWEQGQELKLNRQIFLIGSHLKPLIEAVKQQGTNIQETDTVDLFLQAMIEKMSQESLASLKKQLETSSSLFPIDELTKGKGIAKKNFEGYQPFSDLIQKTLRDRLSRTSLK